jgi:ubiquinone/menaquinone biosynthesis C-methylase UbiE
VLLPTGEIIMSASPKDLHEPSYVLRTGASAAARLRLLDDVYGPASREMMFEAGLAPGMRALDIGCGIGRISCWLSSQVGATGSVVGIDLNKDQLDEAQLEAEATCGENNIIFLERSAYATGFPPESFDFIFCRYLLCHLTDPMDVLAEMYRLLKPGGSLVCVDLDGSAMYSHPPSQALARSIEVAMDTGKALGVDYTFGRKLASALLESGFNSIIPRLDQPIYLNGPGKRMWEHTFYEAGPGIIAAGASSEEEMDQLCRQLCELALDPGVLIAPWASIVCRAIKP